MYKHTFSKHHSAEYYSLYIKILKIIKFDVRDKVTLKTLNFTIPSETKRKKEQLYSKKPMRSMVNKFLIYITSIKED